MCGEINHRLFDGIIEQLEKMVDTRNMEFKDSQIYGTFKKQRVFN